jgi:hypothetical protein
MPLGQNSTSLHSPLEKDQKVFGNQYCKEKAGFLFLFAEPTPNTSVLTQRAFFEDTRSEFYYCIRKGSLLGFDLPFQLPVRESTEGHIKSFCARSIQTKSYLPPLLSLGVYYLSG